MDRIANLLRRKIHRDTVQRSQNLVNERLVLARLLHDKVSSTFLGNLDERITRHILDACIAGERHFWVYI